MLPQEDASALKTDLIFKMVNVLAVQHLYSGIPRQKGVKHVQVDHIISSIREDVDSVRQANRYGMENIVLNALIILSLIQNKANVITAPKDLKGTIRAIAVYLGFYDLQVIQFIQ